MRLMLFAAIGMGVCGWLAADGEPVHADEVDPTSRAVQTIAPSAAAMVSVLPFEVNSRDLPQWLGRSFQRSLEEELQSVPGLRTLIGVSAATQPSTTAEYTIRGTCTGTQTVLVVNFDVVHTGSQKIVHSVEITGETTDLLQVKAAVRDQVRELFAPSKPATDPQPPRIAPVAREPVSSALVRPIIPGMQFDGSDLEWAMENPGTFSRELEHYQNRSTRPGASPSWGYGHYGSGFGGYMQSPVVVRIDLRK